MLDTQTMQKSMYICRMELEVLRNWADVLATECGIYENCLTSRPSAKAAGYNYNSSQSSPPSSPIITTRYQHKQQVKAIKCFSS
ncbi:hypothetical protein KIN20_002982 [Parelaphostrongylus tenuis]|uniref:Uncharacterized protein n=1 Tax=Parelaphostrongylus tenuis TaxID=148309 RepID=A0AAD5QI76_PARTN|nr:hypothetical protein KIN20_002982 [Parelaphostrongylus tenuis]